MPIFPRAFDRIADFLWPDRKVTIRFTVDFRIARFTLPLIRRLIADDDDGETYRCSIAQWTLNERPPLHVHRGEVSSLRIDGPLQNAGTTHLPLGGLIESPGVTTHLDPVETDRLDRQVQAAVEQTIRNWIDDHGLYFLPRSSREFDRSEADQKARAVIARWVAEHFGEQETALDRGSLSEPDHA
jgi:hypothetical protein